MAYMNCPNCEKRLRTPDGDKPMVLRCPVCRQVFNSSSNGQKPLGAPSAAGAAAPATAGGQADAPAETDAELNVQLSAADEAMLRGYDSGSGLLELTREAYGTSLDSWGSGGQGGVDLDAGGAPPAPRQFQIVATALGLANRLVATFKAELVRTRRNARLGWALVAVLVAVGAVGLWWGTSQVGSTEVHRAKADDLTKRAADLEARLSEEKAENAKLTGRLDTLRGEQVRLQGELTTVRADLAESKAKVQILTAEQKAAADRIAAVAAELQDAKAGIDRLTTDLEDARASIASLKAELEVAKSAAAPPATQPAAREPTTQTAAP